MTSPFVWTVVFGAQPCEFKGSLDVFPGKFIENVYQDPAIGKSVEPPINLWRVHVVESPSAKLTEDNAVPFNSTVLAAVSRVVSARPGDEKHKDICVVLKGPDPGESPQLFPA
jgi:hypothetical protein